MLPVGIEFLYGTEYAFLGSGIRLALIGLVVLGSLTAGEVVERAGATRAAGRAAAGPSSASARSATWVAPEPSGADVSTPLEPRSLVEGDENDGRGIREAQRAPA